MKYSKQATSIVEAVIVMFILTLWVLWTYALYDSSIKVADTTANRVEAIAIAREWIEAVTNIRDTNWQIYPADTHNCWNTFNYNGICVWAGASSSHRIWSGRYVLYTNSDNRWIIDTPTSDSFALYTSTGGLYQQATSTWAAVWSWFINTWFTREIIITYPDWNNTTSMQVESRVTWIDRSGGRDTHIVSLQTTLNNWKK